MVAAPSVTLHLPSTSSTFGGTDLVPAGFNVWGADSALRIELAGALADDDGRARCRKSAQAADMVDVVVGQQRYFHCLPGYCFSARSMTILDCKSSPGASKATRPSLVATTSVLCEPPLMKLTFGATS